ncbi:MAG TPA: universal stress protein [Terriglobales bacterium]|jgi:nucleotide-binding universal stress UspA family protein|nr:universal stress protein [Terriglobales bacterium]
MEARTPFKKILVPLDGSELAEQILPYVRYLAEACALSIEFLRVNDLESMTPYAPPLQGEQYLRRVLKEYFASTARTRTSVELGRPAEVIVDYAKVDPSCWIAMATHGMSGIRRWALGSVVSKVALSTVNPLLIVRPTDRLDRGAAIEFKTIFVPLDGSGLAERVLPHVVALATRLKVEVQLMRVYTLPPEAYFPGDGVMGQSAAPFKEKLQSEAETYLNAKVQELRAEGLESVSTTAIQGDAASEIIDVACKTDNPLIAMSTHGRSGVGRWMLGSVAEKVIQHSRVPVLLIRPA